MIQDMFGPEYYLDLFETRNTSTGENRLASGRYRDVTSVTVSAFCSPSLVSTVNEATAAVLLSFISITFLSYTSEPVFVYET